MKRSRASFAVLGAMLFLASGTPVVAAAGEAPSPELDRFYLRFASGPRDLSRLAGCLVNRNVEGARQLFDHAPDSEAYQQVAQQLNQHGGNCLFMTWELRSTNLMFLGAVAEVLTDRDGVALPTTMAVQDGPSRPAGGGSHLWTWRNLTDVAAARSLPLAECLLERHPDQVSAVLEARQTSDGERKLFNALNDEVDDCIPAGESRTLQPQILRAAFAIVYYTSARSAGVNANDGAAG